MDADSYTRRRLLRTGAGVAATGVTTAALTGGAAAQEYDGHLDDVENFDGQTSDATGMDTVTIAVGAGGNGLLFDPAAVVVDPGAVVEFEWTGEGGAHNVVETGGADDRFLYSGDTVDATGVEYTVEPEEDNAGVHPYYCDPHRQLGMKGVLVVGEDNVDGDTYPFGEGEEGLSIAAIAGGSAVFGAVSLLGVAAYAELFGDE